MNCYLRITSTNKAKNDIDLLMEKNGFKDLSVGPHRCTKIRTFILKLLTVCCLPFKIHKGDTLLIQYPFKKYYVAICRIAHFKGAHTITLIHDLGTFRRHAITDKEEIYRLSHTDAVIAHNPTMIKWLEEHGLKKPLISLDIFDYVSETEPNNYPSPHTPFRIVFAGGLSYRKSFFAYQLDEALNGLHVDLCGPGFDKERAIDWKNVTYLGCLPSDEFVEHMESDFGLVWDGGSLNECSGDWGEYLRINNPHKTSFYLRSGLPVIVWKQSALAPFIVNNHLGISIDSITQIPQAISALSDNDYKMMKTHVMAFSKKLNEGYFFKKAFSTACEILKFQQK